MTDQRHRIAFALALGAALLVPTLPARAAEPVVACPPQPVRVVRSAGGVVDYRGTVPHVPDLCRMSRGDGDGAFYLGAWRSDWPGAGQAYPALADVFAGGTGTRASFITRSVPGLQWRDTFAHEGIEPLTIDGQRYDTIRLVHDREGIEGNTYHSIITSWRDVRTGMVLKVNEDQLAGQSYGPNTTWQAVRVERLP